MDDAVRCEWFGQVDTVDCVASALLYYHLDVCWLCGRNISPKLNTNSHKWLVVEKFAHLSNTKASSNQLTFRQALEINHRLPVHSYLHGHRDCSSQGLMLAQYCSSIASNTWWFSILGRHFVWWHWSNQLGGLPFDTNRCVAQRPSQPPPMWWKTWSTQRLAYYNKTIAFDFHTHCVHTSRQSEDKRFSRKWI